MSIFNEGSDRFMRVAQLATTLREIEDPKLDLVGFDACLMNMVEVHHEIQQSIGIVVGSADEIPQPGWPYHTVLSALVANPEMDNRALAGVIVDEYAKAYPHGIEGKGISFSAVDLSACDQLAARVNKLASVLLPEIIDGAVQRAVGEARRQAQNEYQNQYLDLHAFCSALEGKLTGTPSESASDLASVLNDRYVFHHKSSERRVATYALGVSICFPNTLCLSSDGAPTNAGRDGVKRNVDWDSYKALTFAHETAWDDFVEVCIEKRVSSLGP